MTLDLRVLAVGLAAIIAFAGAFKFSGLVKRARAAAAAAKDAMAVISDKGLDDQDKELLVRRAAIQMFGQFALITLSATAVLAAPFVVMWMGDLSGVASFAAVSDLLLSWEVVIGATILVLAVTWIVRRI